MKLKVLERSKDKLKIEVRGETHTLLNLLREASWKFKALQSSYVIEHPYLSEPKIIIRARNPKRTLSQAAQFIADEAEEFGKKFKRALSK